MLMKSIPALSDPEFAVLKEYVCHLLDFNIDRYKDTFLQRRFEVRKKIYHLSSYREYLHVLQNNRKERDQLRNELSIHVTEFFRDPSLYIALQNHILPELVNAQDTIRIWSAGCADGKEAYSIAMIANELLKLLSPSKTVTILGTDIDRTCLEQAKAGVYRSALSLKQTDIASQLSFINHPEEYFDIRGNTYLVKPSLKKLVRFTFHDLTSVINDDIFDIIFCRNVMIYFTRAFQEELCHRFCQTLRSGGYLFLGSTEKIPGIVACNFTAVHAKQKIYKKLKQKRKKES